MFKNFNYSKTVLIHGACYFFFFSFSLFWWSENINLFFTIPVCFFLILTIGISHGALDHIKGKKVLNFYKMKNILIFYISYLAITIFILIFWFFLPTI